MKQNDYVRTKNGDLFILDDIIDNKVIPRYIHLPYAVWENEINKSSPNVLDLIEPMDLLYIDIDPDDGCGGITVPRIAETQEELDKIKNKLRLNIYMLKGVITREQLNRMIYEIRR